MFWTSAVTLHQTSFAIFVFFVVKFIDHKPQNLLIINHEEHEEHEDF